MRKFLHGCLIFIQFGTLYSCALLMSTAANALTIIDDNGDRIEFSAPVDRVVSLEPALSEIVCALKRCSVLVGVDRYSNWPRSLQALPSLGGGIDPNVEQIYRLHPQVILSSKSALMKKKMGHLGVKVLEFDMTHLEDIHRVILALSPLIGVSLEDAQRLWRDIQEGLQQTAAKVSPRARGERVFFEVSSDYFAASKSSYLGELLDRLGLKNVIGSDWGSFPKLNPEYIVDQNPQIIMLGHQAPTDFHLSATWRGTDAVKAKRICLFDHEQFDVLSRPGPRVVQAMQSMVQCINSLYPNE